MAFLFWDASALAKRYTAEVGREIVNTLFSRVHSLEMATTPWGYLETYSILLRRLNSGVLTAAAFAAAVTALQSEVVDSSDFGLLPIDTGVVFASPAIMRRHNLNATDAALLTMLLEHLQTTAIERSDCILVASDRRLLRASATEGLGTLNPEE